MLLVALSVAFAAFLLWIHAPAALMLGPLIAGIVVAYFIISMFMDEVPLLLITLPLTFPLITSLGFDPLWFGVMSMLMVAMGLVFPPVGLLAFVVALQVFIVVGGVTIVTEPGARISRIIDRRTACPTAGRWSSPQTGAGSRPGAAARWTGRYPTQAAASPRAISRWVCATDSSG